MRCEGSGQESEGGRVRMGRKREQKTNLSVAALGLLELRVEHLDLDGLLVALNDGRLRGKDVSGDGRRCLLVVRAVRGRRGGLGDASLLRAVDLSLEAADLLLCLLDVGLERE